jgi:malonyl-CoA O-methyltransferase
MNSPDGTLNPEHVQRRLQAAAGDSDRAEFIFGKTAEGLFERLEPMRIEPARILDLGCGSGARMRPLARKYPRSRVIGVDISAAMLAKAAARGRWWSKPSVVAANAAALPFANNSIDLVFANLLLPYSDDIAALLKEISRVLRKDGVFVFASLGPDSFRQFRSAWQAAYMADMAGTASEHVRAFPDMHHVGDAMFGAGLRDVVVDVEYLDLSYTSTKSMYRDLTAAGARNCLANRRRTLTGRGSMARMEAALAEGADGDSWKITLELVFGHAWGTSPVAADDEFHIDAGSIGHRGG